MAIDRMLTEAEPVGDLIGRVLHEAGIEYVFGISGGPYRPNHYRPQQIPELCPYDHGARGVTRGGDGRGLRPAHPPPRRADWARAMGPRQRYDRHDGGVPVVLRDAAAH